jgi:hypothetical protein
VDVAISSSDLATPISILRIRKISKALLNS